MHSRLLLFSLLLLTTSTHAQDTLYALSTPHPDPCPGFYEFGSHLAGIDDLDGDSVTDILVGSPEEAFYSSDAEIGRTGNAYVFSGARGHLLHVLRSPNPQDEGKFGDAVAAIGDVDGDGMVDLAVAAWGERFSVDPGVGGIVHVFSGATGLVLYSIKSPGLERRDLFGSSLAATGDHNGDGVNDLLVGAMFAPDERFPYRPGRVYLYSGADGSLVYEIPYPEEEGFRAFGKQVATAGDISGDGIPEFLIGAPGGVATTGGPPRPGRAYLHDGRDGALLRTLASPVDELYSLFGLSLLGLSDLNGDQVPEIFVGAPGEDSVHGGRGYIFDGATGAVMHSLFAPDADGRGTFAISAASIPDQDGDGLADLLIGDSHEQVGPEPYQPGRVVIVSTGSGEILFSLHSLLPTQNGRFGRALAVAGDLDGDRRIDYFVGASRERSPASPCQVGRVYAFSGALPVANWSVPGSSTPSATTFPNPFHEFTQVQFGLPKRSPVRISVLNAIGRQVSSLRLGPLNAGFHSIDLPTDIWPAAGLYLILIETADTVFFTKATKL